MSDLSKEQVDAAFAEMTEADRRIIDAYSKRLSEQNNWFVENVGIWTLAEEYTRAKKQTCEELGVTVEQINATVDRWQAKLQLARDAAAGRAVEVLS